MTKLTIRHATVEIPEKWVSKLKRSDYFAEESIIMCLEITDELESAFSARYRIGFHIMTLDHDDLGRRIVKELGK